MLDGKQPVGWADTVLGNIGCQGFNEVRGQRNNPVLITLAAADINEASGYAGRAQAQELRRSNAGKGQEADYETVALLQPGPPIFSSSDDLEHGVDLGGRVIGRQPTGSMQL